MLSLTAVGAQVRSALNALVVGSFVKFLLAPMALTERLQVLLSFLGILL